jgi:uncharacterized membrane protein
MTEQLWVFLVIGGPVLLAVLIGIALFQRGRRTPSERAATERATARLYDGDEKNKDV